MGRWNGGILVFERNDRMGNLGGCLCGEGWVCWDLVGCFEEENRGNIWIGREGGLDWMEIVRGRVLDYGERVDWYGLSDC